MNREPGSAAIAVEELGKTFQVPVREPGLRSAIASLFNRVTNDVVAVDDVSFTVEAGEIVGFLGPNGAGKTTTLKMLSGLLHPSAGHARVLGFTPFDRDKNFLRQISLIMGNRNQLQWDLPALDSFEMSRAVYRIPRSDFEQQRDELIDLLDLDELVSKPVRNLSLGERMKAEIANSLLHRPAVLFLDEPTLGLDVVMQRRIRSFLADYNRRHNATILLTSHYMADVEALCRRVMVISDGSLVFDGELDALSDKFADHRTLVVTLSEPVDLSRYGTVVDASTPSRPTIRIGGKEAASVTSRLLAEQPVIDLTIEQPPIDDVIEQAFGSASSTKPGEPTTT